MRDYCTFIDLIIKGTGRLAGESRGDSTTADVDKGDVLLANVVLFHVMACFRVYLFFY